MYNRVDVAELEMDERSPYMNVRFLTLVAAAGLLIVLAGCSSSPTQSNLGEIKIHLIDAPLDIQHAYIVVDEVDAHVASSDSTKGWVTLNKTRTTYDLLKLTNGASALLAGAQLAPGHYTQIRLMLDTGSTVVINDVSYPLTIPSGLQSGLKLNHEFDITAGNLYELTLDFNAEQSINPGAGSTYTLNPVIRVEATVTSGTISGTVLPVAARATVWTMVDTDTVSTNCDTTSGAFQLMALPAGTYTVTINSGSTLYADSTITGVNVTAQQNTSLGTITLRTL